MTITASTMIMRSLRLIGEKPVGGTLSSGEQTDYLADLNTMIESWSIERLMCYQIVLDSKALSASTASYTIGSGGAWNTARPTKVVDPCYVRDSYSADTPVTVIGADSYGKLVLKSTGNTYPDRLYYDAAFAAGLGTIYLYPAPIAGLTLYISSWKQLQSFANVTTALLLPPGYQRAIEFNFAIEVSGGYRNVDAAVAKIARESKTSIESLNIPDAIMKIDAGLVRRHSSILTGP